MNKHRIRRIVTGLGLSFPLTTLVGCGDPCLDDGFGQGDGADCPVVTGADGTDGDSSGDSGDPPADDSTGEPMPEPEELWYHDFDEDGFGDPNDSITVHPDEVPPGYVQNAQDCDDNEPFTHPGAGENEAPELCMNDNDEDGWGDAVVPEGVDAGTDCDDDAANTYPGAAENEDPLLCTNDDDGDGWGDSEPGPGVDPGDDCADRDPELWGCETIWCLDEDGDGFGDADNCIPGGDTPPSPDHVPNDDDCSDDNADVYPGAAENEPRLCTADIDDDGWGTTDPPPGADAGTDCSDENADVHPGAAANEADLCTVDADGDGWGDADAQSVDPDAENGTDCLDSDADIFPGAAANEAELCTIDADGDGWGDATPPPGADAGTDCDDASDVTFPGASENELPPLNLACTTDADGDGYGDTGAGGDVTPGTDCNDGSATTFPGAAELDSLTACMEDDDDDGYGDTEPPDGVTAGQDCEDEDITVTICGVWCLDSDGDGFGDGDICELADTAPTPDHVPNGSDCLDSDANTFPGAAQNELPPLDTACTTDADDDGYGDENPAIGVTAGTDCVDTAAEVFVGAAANEPLLCTVDADDDGYGADDASATYGGADNGTDCDDNSAFAFPGASENELPPLLTACTEDADEDGYGDSTPSGDATPGTDCDDGTATTFPGAAPLDDPLACMADADDDDYGDTTAPPGGLAGTDCDDTDAGVTSCEQWCQDTDGDGFGGDLCVLADSAPGPDWVQNSADCVDTDANTFPGAAENEPALCATDADDDGWGSDTPVPGADAGSDCNDLSANTFVGAAENEPGLCAADEDDDGWGDSTPPPGVDAGSDCADDNANIFVGAAELEPALCAEDEDDDGYGDALPPPGVDAGSDCADGDANIFVGAAELEPALCAEDADNDGWGNDSPPVGVDAGSDCDDSSNTTFPGSAPLEADAAGCYNDDDDDDYGDNSPPAGVTPGLDCDDTDPTFADCTCLSPVDYLQCDGTADAPTTDLFNSMGVGCSDDISESMVLANSTIDIVDDASWRIISQYGTALDPADPTRGIWSTRPDAGNPDAQHNGGNNILLLSTGPTSVPDGNGVLVEAPGSQDSLNATGNPDGGGYPGGITETVGSNGGAGGTPFENCDLVNDCSDSLNGLGLAGLGMNDQIYFEMELDVPAGVDGFRFDFVYFSSEYPQWVGTQFNDIFTIWVDGQAFTGNVAVTQDGTPFTITELFNAGEMTVIDDDPLLEGTGYEGHSASGWRSVLSPVIPGDTITVGFFLADVADDGLATSVLIDNFRWDCAGCDGVGDCGLTSL